MAKRTHAIQANRDVRAVLTPAQKPLDEKSKALVLALLQAGATILEVTRRKGMPKLGDVWATLEADAVFKVAFHKAAANGAATMLAEAQDVARDAAISGDPDEVRAADMYMRVVEKYVEKIAPREYGQLVKLAGDEAHAAITVQLVQFAAPEPAPSE